MMLSSLGVSRRSVLFGSVAAALCSVPWAVGARRVSRGSVIPFFVPDKLTGAEMVAAPHVRLAGWLGARVEINRSARLAAVDLEPLLAGFRQKPGSHPWIGEHIGKWMHAATLSWAQSGDDRLKARLDYAASALVTAQESDGYLGTYTPDNRFNLSETGGWDVWSHKYCLIGLLNYYRYTGNAPALAASRKAADLLLRTFSKRGSIIKAGHHAGMAATSVLEPIVLLHRITADSRYLDFAHHIVSSWETPEGPKVLSTLLSAKKVEKVGNAKAYEMMSTLVGLCELARITGDRSLVQAGLNAWEDIVATQRVITGTASDGEFFQPDGHLGEEHMPRLGETCVTTTWIQLNQALFQLTGEARFGNELERTYYNALTAAQHPAGHDWCYFTPMNGQKKYDKDVSCCHSSGPRGLALAPLSSYLTSRERGGDYLLVSTLETSNASLTIGGRSVRIKQVSNFPDSGSSRLRIGLGRPAHFGLKIRVPDWASPMSVPGATLRNGWAEIAPRTWKDGDTIELVYQLKTALNVGTGDHNGREIQSYGPFVLAYETEANGRLPAPDLVHYTAPAEYRGKEPFLAFEAPVTTGEPPHHHEGQKQVHEIAKLVTYADAGIDGSYYRVWLRRRA